MKIILDGFFKYLSLFILFLFIFLSFCHCNLNILVSKSSYIVKMFAKKKLSKKQRFSLLHEKAVIQAVCLRTQTVSKKAWFYGFRPKGRALGTQEKSENFNSLRPILFQLCKKNYRGGVNPPPQQEQGLNVSWVYQNCDTKS